MYQSFRNKQGRTAGTKKETEVMISYSDSDKIMMTKLKEDLRANDITVWEDTVVSEAGVDRLGKRAEAIINAKIVITLLSKESIENRYCQDEVVFASVSKKPIIPVGLKRKSDLFPMMEEGMRLSLAKYKWHTFLEEDEIDANLEKFVTEIKAQISCLLKEDKIKRMVTEIRAKISCLLKGDKIKRMGTKESQTDNDSEKKQLNKNDLDFEAQISRILSEEDLDAQISHILSEDDLDFEAQISRILNEDNSKRMATKESQTDAKINYLCEYLKNNKKDCNDRTIAAISLIRTRTNDPQVIGVLKEILKDKDRLVRQSGCLALGQLGAKSAVGGLVELWRNDDISSVRDAAQLALEQIGGQEAEKAMHVTKVLGEEIKELSKV